MKQLAPVGGVRSILPLGVGTLWKVFLIPSNQFISC